MNGIRHARLASRSLASFSLVELLVVMTVIGILSAALISIVPAITVSSNLTRGGQLVASQISLARQEAVTSNREVRVMFYKFSHGAITGWCGLQVVRIDPTSSGTTTNAVGRLTVLPDGIVISPDTVNYSPLLVANASLGNATATTTLPVQGTATVAGFSFRANGSPDYTVAATNNFLTIQSVHAGTPPKNFFTLRLNPVGGKITLFRP